MCLNRLAAIAETGVLSLLPLSCPQLAAVLPQLLPKGWQNASRAVAWTPGEGGQPTREWMLLLWRKMKVYIFITTIQGLVSPVYAGLHSQAADL